MTRYYYAAARNDQGQLQLLGVTVKPHPTKQSTSQEWLPVVFASTAEANDFMESVHAVVFGA